MDKFEFCCDVFLFGVEVDLPERPLPPEMVIFYITQDTQRHPLLPEIKSGLSSNLEILPFL